MPFSVIQKCPKTNNVTKFLIYIGQMTEIFPRKNTGEKDEVIDRASTSSVTMSDRHVPSQSGAGLGGARWGLCPPIILPGPTKFFRSLFESPTQTIDTSLVAKLAPPAAPPNEKVWLRPWPQYYGSVIMFGWRWRNVCIR